MLSDILTVVLQAVGTFVRVGRTARTQKTRVTRFSGTDRPRVSERCYALAGWLTEACLFGRVVPAETEQFGKLRECRAPAFAAEARWREDKRMHALG